MLLEALSAAADEIARELAPGSVEVRLRGRRGRIRRRPARGRGGRTEPEAPEIDEAATARINLRLPERIKEGVEEAATRERVSVNSWLVRAIAGAVAKGSVRGSARGGSASPIPGGCAGGLPSIPADRSTPRSTRHRLVRITAGDVATTTVEVRPSDETTPRTCAPPRGPASSSPTGTCS